MCVYLTFRFGQGGELDSLNQVSAEACIDSVLSNRDIVVGIKVRLTADVSDNGKNEQEAYRCQRHIWKTKPDR